MHPDMAHDETGPQPGEHPGDVNEPPAPHASQLKMIIEALNADPDHLPDVGDVEERGSEAQVTITDRTIARFVLICREIPRAGVAGSFGTGQFAFGRAGCWPDDSEPPASSMARGVAAEAAYNAAAALRGGEIIRARRLLTSALRHLDAVAGRTEP